MVKEKEMAKTHKSMSSNHVIISSLAVVNYDYIKTFQGCYFRSGKI